MASQRGDPGLLHGDYECAMGTPKSQYGLQVYRTTVR
jgi:hypothetical protein